MHDEEPEERDRHPGGGGAGPAGRSRGGLPGQDHDRRGHDHAERRSRSRSSRCRRPRPRTSTPSAPASRCEAVDDQSTYPASAPRTKLSGFTPNVEAIAKYKPDLVIISNDNGGKLAKRLKALKIPVMLAAGGAQAERRLRADQPARPRHRSPPEGEGGRREDEEPDRRRSSPACPSAATPLTYYHELGPDLYSATSSTFIGQIYGLLGLKNIADEADGAELRLPAAERRVPRSRRTPTSSSWRTRSAASRTRRPSRRARAGSAMKAVKNGGVVELDDDIASRWGPRIVNYLRTRRGSASRRPSESPAPASDASR